MNITLTLTSAGLVLLLALPLQPSAQTTPRPSAPHSAVPRSSVAHSSAQRAAGTAARAEVIKVPATIPVVKGVLHTAFALRYIDILVGTGAPAEPGMIYTVHYTGYMYDGTKFDSSVDRGTPFPFQQGRQRVISGWDTGFEGMKVGGKRRLFIPYQLAYGDAGKAPIPPKANLIFDVELVDVKNPNAPRPASLPPQ